MALDVLVGIYTKPASTTGTDTVTTTGVDPKALLLWGNRNNTGIGEVGGSSSFFIGFSDGVNDRCMSSQNEDGVAACDFRRFQSNLEVAVIFSPGSATIEARGIVDSFGTDQFVIDWTFNSSLASQLHFIVWGGSDITGVQVGSFTKITTIANQSITTDSDVQDIQANLGVIFFLRQHATAQNSVSNNASVGFSMATAVGEQVGYFWTGDDQNTNMEARLEWDETNCIVRHNPTAGGGDSEGKFNGFDSLGFDIDWVVQENVPAVIYFMIIKGGQWEVGKAPTETSTGTKSYTTGFQPDGIFAFIWNNTSTNLEDTRRDGAMCLGASDLTNSNCCGDSWEDTSDPTNVGVFNNNTALFLLTDPVTPTNIDGEADVDSVTATTFVLDYVDAFTAAFRFGYLVFASEVGGLSIVKNVTLENVNIAEIDPVVNFILGRIRNINETIELSEIDPVERIRIMVRNVTTENINLSEVKDRIRAMVRNVTLENIIINENYSKTFSGIVSRIEGDGNVLDQEGSNNGTWTGTEQYKESHIEGKAMDFNGTSRVNLANEANFDREFNQPFSISAWIKIPATAVSSWIAGKATGLGIVPGYKFFLTTGGNLRLRLGNGSTTFQGIGTTILDDDVFHHVVGTYDGSSDQDGLKVYVDGVLENTAASTAITGSMLNNDTFSIGADNDGGTDIIGVIDNVQFYTAELTADEIRIMAEAPNYIRGRTQNVTTETVEINEVSPVQSILGVVRNIAETIEISMIDPVVNFVRGRIKNVTTENIEIDEADPVDHPLVMVRNVITENINISEVKDRIRDLVRTVTTEVVEINEALNTIRGRIKNLTENIEINEASPIQGILGIVRNVATETIELSEAAVIKILGIVQVVTLENINISEVKDRIRSLVRTVTTENVNVSEVLNRLGTLVRNVTTENINISEVLNRVRSLVRVVTLENVNIGEVLNRIVTAGGGLVEVINETINISEAKDRIRSLVRFVSESISISESLDRIGGTLVAGAKIFMKQAKLVSKKAKDIVSLIDKGEFTTIIKVTAKTVRLVRIRISVATLFKKVFFTTSAETLLKTSARIDADTLLKNEVKLEGKTSMKNEVKLDAITTRIQAEDITKTKKRKAMERAKYFLDFLDKL